MSRILLHCKMAKGALPNQQRRRREDTARIAVSKELSIMTVLHHTWSPTSHLFARVADAMAELVSFLRAAGELSARAENNERISVRDVKRSGLV